MSRLKFVSIEVKVLKRISSLGVIPGIAEKNSSDIPKDGADFRHSKPPAG
jgi:hypothetical protein